MINTLAELNSDCTYHIYNRAIGNEKLFITSENYLFFLKRYEQYIAPIADTFCYCLMPNHFHLLIRIKDEAHLKSINHSNLDNPSKFLSLQFSHFSNSYSKAYNKQERRRGALWMRPFKRKKIDTMDYFIKVVKYIHFNPVVSGLCRKPEEWIYSSYKSIISDSQTRLRKQELIDIFEGKDNFKYMHRISSVVDEIVFD